MAGFKRSILVQKPVEEVFDFATNLDNAPLFMVGLTKVELLTEGGIKHGARFRSTRAFKGKERSAILEVVEYERPRVYATRSAMMGFKGSYAFHFAQEGSATRVELVADVSGNLLWWCFLGMLSSAMEKEDGDILRRLKDAIENPKEQ